MDISTFNTILVGKTTDEAYDLLSKDITFLEYKIRTIKKDGVSFFVTQDIDPFRINVKIEKNKIVEIQGLY